MHEAFNSDLRSDLGDPLRTSDMNIGILEVSAKKRKERKKKEISTRLMQQGRKESLGLIISADEVVNDIRMSQTFSYLFFVPYIPFLNTY